MELLFQLRRSGLPFNQICRDNAAHRAKGRGKGLALRSRRACLDYGLVPSPQDIPRQPVTPKAQISDQSQDRSRQARGTLARSSVWLEGSVL